MFKQRCDCHAELLRAVYDEVNVQDSPTRQCATRPAHSGMKQQTTVMGVLLFVHAVV